MSGARFRLYLRLSLVVLAFACIGGGIYGAIFDENTVRGIVRGVLTSVFIGLAITTFEILLAAHENFARLRQAPFALVLLARTIVYLLVIVIGLYVGRLAVREAGAPILDIDGLFKQNVIFSLIASIVFNFIHQIARILGRGVLGSLVLGRYHRPRREERVFLLVDLKGSTGIAERIGDLKFHELLNDVFAALADAVNAVGGDIYKFVGDEAIVVWQPKRGLREGNCLSSFFVFARRLSADADYYRATYGEVPQFKGGAHMGMVVVGEMGSTKQEIAYSGAALNTAARIEQATRQYGKDLLVSDALLKRLGTLPADLRAESVGRITLRGSAEEIELFAVREA